jgi:hypothetical protein
VLGGPGRVVLVGLDDDEGVVRGIEADERLRVGGERRAIDLRVTAEYVSNAGSNPKLWAVPGMDTGMFAPALLRCGHR